MIENEPPPSYEVAIGIKQDDNEHGIIKLPPPSYDITTTNETYIHIEPDQQPSAPRINDAEQPELSNLSCILITMLIAACITVFVLGFRKDK